MGPQRVRLLLKGQTFPLVSDAGTDLSNEKPEKKLKQTNRPPQHSPPAPRADPWASGEWRGAQALLMLLGARSRRQHPPWSCRAPFTDRASSREGEESRQLTLHFTQSIKARGGSRSCLREKRPRSDLFMKGRGPLQWHCSSQRPVCVPVRALHSERLCADVTACAPENTARPSPKSRTPGSVLKAGDTQSRWLAVSEGGDWPTGGTEALPTSVSSL